MRWALVGMLVIGVACTGSTVPPRAPAGKAPASAESRQEKAQAASRSRAIAVLGTTYKAPEAWWEVTGSMEVRPSSILLAHLVSRPGRLTVEAVASRPDTITLKFKEDEGPKDQWGEFMTPAERMMFKAFADSRGMGNWLIVFTDINVLAGPDPIPMTAYRWQRKDVEAYATCGIPSSGIDHCTAKFYLAADTVLIMHNAGNTRHPH